MLNISLEGRAEEVEAPETYKEFNLKLLQSFPELEQNNYSFCYEMNPGEYVTV